MYHDLCPKDRSTTCKVTAYRPPRIAMLLLAIAVALHVAVPTNLTYVFSSFWLAAVLVLAGFTLMTLAWWQFKVRRVAICPTEPTARLVVDGVFRLTRNPMYLGIIMMLLGVAVFVGTLPFYAASFVYFLLIDRWFCRYEEEKLLATFGQSYEQYRAGVRRWI